MQLANPAFNGVGIGCDVAGWLDRMGAEELPGPYQQRTQLIELLLQHRVSHGSQRTWAPMSPQFTRGGRGALGVGGKLPVGPVRPGPPIGRFG